MTAEFIEKRTSIAAVRDKLGQIDTFSTPLLSHCGLPLKGVLQEIFDLRFFRESVGTGDYALYRIFIDSMTPAINLSPVTTTPAMLYRRKQRRMRLIAGANYTDNKTGRTSVCLHLEIKIFENLFNKCNTKG